MKCTALISVLGITLLGLGGCDEETNQAQPLPLVIEGDGFTKALIEEILKENPKIYIPRKNSTVPHQETEYAIQLVKPDPSKNYSILRVEPDPNTEYSMMIIDPRTQKPPANIDPNIADSILEELKKRKEESMKK